MRYGKNNDAEAAAGGVIGAVAVAAKLKKGSARQPGTTLFDERLHLLLLACKQSGNRGCLRMRKDKDQSNDERVNTQRLDQSKTDQHGNGDLTG